MRVLLAIFLAVISFSGPHWNLALTETKASLRGVHNVGGGVIWASGANGTVLRSEDDGYMWQNCKVLPEMEKLDFRAVAARDGNHALVMSSGAGSASRIYETSNGCAVWNSVLVNPDPQGFWDALVLGSGISLILGDPVDGRFAVYESGDGGTQWERDRSPELAAAREGEGAFAASNSSLVVAGDAVLFGTGGLGGPRVFRRDKSRHWSATSAPMAGHKESAGIFSLAFRDSKHGIAVGGDYKQPDRSDGTAAWTEDGGLTWHAAQTPCSGYRSAAMWTGEKRVWVAVGTNGSDISRDDGRSWARFDTGAWNALSWPWAVGPNGRIASLQ